MMHKYFPLWHKFYPTDNINIKILNAGAWSRSSERVPVSLPLELEDFIPEVEDFYRNKHSGRKLQWHHLMSNGIVSYLNGCGFDQFVIGIQKSCFRIESHSYFSMGLK